MSAVGTEGTSTQVIVGTLMDAYVNPTALQSMLFVPCRKRSVKNLFFFSWFLLQQTSQTKSTVRRLGKDEWESVWNKSIVPAVFLDLLGEVDKINENTPSVVRARIRTSYIPHTSLKLCCYTPPPLLNSVYQQQRVYFSSLRDVILKFLFKLGICQTSDTSRNYCVLLGHYIYFLGEIQ